MIKSLVKMIIPLASMLVINEAYAKDIRYVYCATTLVGHGGANYQPVRQDQIVLFSPIFKVDVHNDDGASSVNFSGDFENTVLNDRNDNRTFAHRQLKDVSLNQRGCNFESKSLEAAKKSFDTQYLEQKNLKLSFQDKCRYIAIYSWIPKNYVALYPSKTAITPTTKALIQSCQEDEPPVYK